MKKKCVCLLMAFVLAVSAGCGAGGKEAPLLDLSEAAAVTLQYCGTFAEIGDPAQVACLREMFSTPAYEKGKSSADYVGWEYMVRWYDKSGREIEEVQVNSESLIAYGGYFYTLSSGQLDFQYFKKLLLPFHVTKDLGEIVEALRGSVDTAYLDRLLAEGE